MKIKDGYLLREIADTYIVVPIAERVAEFKGMMTLNAVAAEVWGFLKTDRSYEEILGHVLSVYDIDEKTADEDLKKLLKQMESSGVLEK